MSRDRSRNRGLTASSSVATRTSVDTDASPLAGDLVGYRLLRRIAAGERADVYLATAEPPEASDLDASSFAPTAVAGNAGAGSGDAPTLVAVRVYPPGASGEMVALEIEAMSSYAGGALPALYDVAALDDGRCCLAVERIGGVAVSRLLAERTLSPGEAVTILAPIAAAVGELAELGFVHTRLAASDIVLDDGGRPRLLGLGALRRLPGHERSGERTELLRAGHVALAELVDDVAAATSPAGGFDDAIDLLRRRLDARPFERCEIDLERRLFDAAIPEAIAGVEVRVRAPRLPARTSSPRPVSEVFEEPLPDGGRRAGGIRGLFGLAQLPDDLGSRLATTLDAVPGTRARSRLAAAMGAKRRVLAFGGFIGGAALVLLLTLVPPATATGTDDSARPSSAGARQAASATAAGTVDGSAEDAVASSADDAAPGAESTGDDPVAAAQWLLERRRACFEAIDLGCLEAVVQPGSAIEANDRAAMFAAQDGSAAFDEAFDLATVKITGEMGDAVLVAVTRTAPERRPASLLVVRGEAGWRLREIFG